jgi:hypothetical protein
MSAGGRYLSSDDPVRTFAAPGATIAIEVRWQDGSTVLLGGLPPNHVYEIDQTPTAPLAGSTSPSIRSLFADVSSILDHQVLEEPFDDFSRQPLLPRKLSQNGPPAAWLDWNGDGWEDLVIGGPKNGSIALFENTRDGKFKRLGTSPFNVPLKRDVSSFVLAPVGTELTLLCALSNYEDALAYGPALVAFSPRKNSPQELLPAWDSSAGALAVADIDLDGDLDLFIGGSSVPGFYPQPATSRLLLYQDGRYQPDRANEALFSKLGLANSAVFADIDSDGDPDLLLACEWSPVRLFLNDKGTFSEATDRFGLQNAKGLWQGIAVGDFNEDGRIDFIASNWGRNSKYESARSHPMRLYSGDFDQDGTYDIIEARFDLGLNKYVPDRQRGVLGASLQFVQDRFRTHAAYSRAGIDEILGEALSSAAIHEANWIESTVFLNLGDRFEARPLPTEAQFAPGFGIAVADFNNDSHKDIVLAQNFFAVTPETPRYDGGRSLLLLGDGKGNFRSVPGHESGLLVYGEQRSVAAADFDRDGRTDLVITQNGAQVKLYRNQYSDEPSR